MPEEFWKLALDRFDNVALRQWADELGIETFVASSGRVFPVSLKGAPMLRRWIERLRASGVDFRMSHRLCKINVGVAEFDEGRRIEADVIVLALGGGSWPQTGSDGAWVPILKESGVEVSPLASANSGWEVAWPAELIEQIEGQPIKNVVLSADGEETMGELMLTRYGMEGGPIYKLGATLRAMSAPKVILDLKPSFTKERLVAKMESARRNFLKEAKYRWKLNDASRLLLDAYHGPFESAAQLAEAVKNFEIPLTRPRPLGEAISSAGGVRWSEVGMDLMLKNLPGVFVAGEMVDWEAPTGGYLLQGCFATGTLAAESAMSWSMV